MNCCDGFQPGFIDHGRRPDFELRHPVENLVPRPLGEFGVPVGPQSRRRLREHCKQGGFSVGEIGGRFVKVSEARRLHALDRPAEGRDVQIQLENLVLW